MTVQPHAYSAGIESKTVALLGPAYPPPYGGIRVHLARVAATLRAQHNRVHHFDTLAEHRYRYFVWYLVRLTWFLLCRRPDVVMYHTLYVRNSGVELWLLVMLKKILSYRLMVIDHNCRHLYSRTKKYKQRLTRLLSSVDHQVMIGTSTYRSFVDTGVVPAPVVTVERAFLPPLPDEHTTLHYPPDLEQFFVRHASIMLVAVTRLVLVNGRDLYGADGAYELFVRARSAYPELGLLYLMGGIDDAAHYQMLRARVVRDGYDDTVLFLCGVYPLLPLLKRCTIFVRPTLSDGASVGEDEAHYCGVTVVATDVCERHPATHVFRAGNWDEGAALIKQVLHERSTHGITRERDRLHAQSSC